MASMHQVSAETRRALWHPLRGGQSGNALLFALLGVAVTGAFIAATFNRISARTTLERANAAKQLAGSANDDSLALMSQYFEGGRIAPDCYLGSGGFVTGPSADAGFKNQYFGGGNGPLSSFQLQECADAATTPQAILSAGGVAQVEATCAKRSTQITLVTFDCNGQWAKIKGTSGGNTYMARVKFAKPPPPIPAKAVVGLKLIGGLDGDQVLSVDYRSGLYTNRLLRGKYYAARIHFHVDYYDGTSMDTPDQSGPTNYSIPGDWTLVAAAHPKETAMYRAAGKGNPRLFLVRPQSGTTVGFQFEDGCCGRPGWVGETVDFQISRGF